MKQAPISLVIFTKISICLNIKKKIFLNSFICYVHTIHSKQTDNQNLFRDNSPKAIIRNLSDNPVKRQRINRHSAWNLHKITRMILLEQLCE